SSFNVVRLKRDVGDNGHVGVMATMTTHAEPANGYPLATLADGGSPQAPQLCPNTSPTGSILVPRGGRCFNDAYVGSTDWRWRAPGGAWVTGGQLVAT